MSTLKILLSSMNGQGHVNALLGLAGMLKPFNHDLIFALSPAWESSIKSKGYPFVPLQFTVEDDSNKNDGKPEKAPMQAFIEFLSEQLEILRKDPMEALETFSSDKLATPYIGLATEMTSFEQPLKTAIETIKPDLIIIDFPFRLPCLIKTKIPWIQLWSCSPLAVYKTDCPPDGSGISVHDPKEKWARYRELYKQKFQIVRERFNEFLVKGGVDPIAENDSLFLFESPHMNIYNYPEALDYTDVAPRPAKWFRMDAVIREPDNAAPFVIPDNLINKPGKLIYFSLGSMGSVDLELMRRVISVFAKIPHRFIVSKGPYHDQIDLPDNCWGEKYVNQIAILPYCDLVITHGGNNTLTESLYFGKPLIVMPLFYDQLDNAQRIADKKLGVRLNTYNFTDDQLTTAIEKLINDHELYSKLGKISSEMKGTKTNEMIIKLIEETAIKGKTHSN